MAKAKLPEQIQDGITDEQKRFPAENPLPVENKQTQVQVTGEQLNVTSDTVVDKKEEQKPTPDLANPKQTQGEINQEQEPVLVGSSLPTQNEQVQESTNENSDEQLNVTGDELVEETEMQKSLYNPAKLIRTYVELYPKNKVFYITTDMQVFLSTGKRDAELHQQNVDPNEEVYVFEA
ncbi:hypothetical protein [Pinibacter soli]|uniref:Uncharacterized protein n=1 Tax=Pinibacter soli TaxID=3044211 RepID=A0ABT6R998_9BACT|nr:hypothetical protein [Pinibacter soli]MDI3319133.1 hypothetical protein [Pinibacter soli]